MHSKSLEAAALPDARVLVLGTLPGRVSLERREYYAHPQNAFWRIMGLLYRASSELPYQKRIDRLLKARIALWDVCAAAHRPGSLDSAIQRSSVQPNNVADFLGTHSSIELICFNGREAAQLFRRLVLPSLTAPAKRPRLETLPSTSPAHAGMPFDEKLSHWRKGLLDRGMVQREIASVRQTLRQSVR